MALNPRGEARLRGRAGLARVDDQVVLEPDAAGGVFDGRFGLRLELLGADATAEDQHAVFRGDLDVGAGEVSVVVERLARGADGGRERGFGTRGRGRGGSRATGGEDVGFGALAGGGVELGEIVAGVVGGERAGGGRVERELGEGNERALVGGEEGVVEIDEGDGGAAAEIDDDVVDGAEFVAAAGERFAAEVGGANPRRGGEGGLAFERKRAGRRSGTRSGGGGAEDFVVELPVVGGNDDESFVEGLVDEGGRAVPVGLRDADAEAGGAEGCGEQRVDGDEAQGIAQAGDAAGADDGVDDAAGLFLDDEVFDNAELFAFWAVDRVAAELADGAVDGIGWSDLEFVGDIGSLGRRDGRGSGAFRSGGGDAWGGLGGKGGGAGESEAESEGSGHVRGHGHSVRRSVNGCR